MKHFVGAVALIGLCETAFAQIVPAPEECVVPAGGTVGASAVFNGRTYTFTKPECRDVFLSDPERFAQLYDALIELAAAGAPLQVPPQDASLVPS